MSDLHAAVDRVVSGRHDDDEWTELTLAAVRLAYAWETFWAALAVYVNSVNPRERVDE